MKLKINNKNAKGQWVGYQEWYTRSNKLWFRGHYKNEKAIGYQELNIKLDDGIGDEGTQVEFYIK
jgi:hypothetical protein